MKRLVTSAKTKQANTMLFDTLHTGERPSDVQALLLGDASRNLNFCLVEGEESTFVLGGWIDGGWAGQD